jgi:NAD-dependent SIR2 family protein deacetylase
MQPGTFKDLVRLIAEQSCPNSEKPLIVMDAGISTEDNLTEIRNLGYDYIKLCTRPTKDQMDIFNAMGFKHRPFVRKTKVMTQM